MSICVRLAPPNTDFAYVVIGGQTHWVKSGGLGYPLIVGGATDCSDGVLIRTDSELGAFLAARQQTISLEVDAAPDPERVTDMQILFYAFLAVLVVVWGMKQLLNMFTVNSDRD